MNERMRSALKKLSYAFFPNRCASCSALIAPGEVVCFRCSLGAPRIEGEICLHCGRAREECCCETQAFDFEHLAGCFCYAGDVRVMIHKMKFRGERRYAVYFGLHVAQTVERVFPDAELSLALAVPMTKRDKKKRGYNQSEIIAKTAAGLLGIPFSASALKKTAETGKQHELSAEERKNNLQNVFTASPEQVKGQNILLCDDVKTTGATLYRVSQALLKAGAKNVYCVCAAVA